MQITSLIDNNFDKNITSSYFLSIQLMLDGFSFCVLDPISNEYIQFYTKKLSFEENLTKTLQQEIETNHLLKLKYQKVFILYQTHQITLVPSALYSDDNMGNYIDFCFRKNETIDEKIFNKKVRMADSYCLFGIPNQITSIIDSNFNNVIYFCQTIPFIESILLNTSNKREVHQLHLNIQNSSFEALLTSGNDLKLHNVFKFQNKKEFIYYVLYIFEQLKLDTKETRVYMSGNIEKNNELYLLSKKYLKQLELSNSSRYFKFSTIFRNQPLQNHLNLINIPLCV